MPKTKIYILYAGAQEMLMKNKKTKKYSADGGDSLLFIARRLIVY